MFGWLCDWIGDIASGQLDGGGGFCLFGGRRLEGKFRLEACRERVGDFVTLASGCIFGQLHDGFSLLIEELDIFFELRMAGEFSGILPCGLGLRIAEPYDFVNGLSFATWKFLIPSVNNFLDNVLFVLSFFTHGVVGNKKIMIAIFRRRFKPLQRLVDIFIRIDQFINIGKLMHFWVLFKGRKII